MSGDRKIDALIAERVFGLPVLEGPDPYVHLPGLQSRGRDFWLKGSHEGCYYDWALCPAYTSSVELAIGALERLREREERTYWMIGSSTYADPRWTVHLRYREYDGARFYECPLPEAICRHVLHVLGVSCD